MGFTPSSWLRRQRCATSELCSSVMLWSDLARIWVFVNRGDVSDKQTNKGIQGRAECVFVPASLYSGQLGHQPTRPKHGWERAAAALWTFCLSGGTIPGVLCVAPSEPSTQHHSNYIQSMG